MGKRHRNLDHRSLQLAVQAPSEGKVGELVSGAHSLCLDQGFAP